MPRFYSLLPLSAAAALACGIASSANTSPSMPGAFFGEGTVNLSSRAEVRGYAPRIMSDPEKPRHAAMLPRNANGVSNGADLLDEAGARDAHHVNWGGVIRIGR